MNKHGKVSGTKVGIWVMAVALVAILAMLVFGNTGLQTAVLNSPQATTTAGASPSLNIVTTNPVQSVNGVDAQQNGVAVGIASSVESINGGSYGSFTVGTSTAIPGQKIDFLLTNGTTYHAAVASLPLVRTDSFPITVQFNKNSSVTETIFNTLGVAIDGAATNQTDNGNGASYNLKDEMTGTSLASTQDMLCVIELTAGTNASTNPSGVTFNGKAPDSTSKPTWYTTAGVNSNVYLFNVDAIKDSKTVTNTIGVNAKSTGRFVATSKIVKTCYTKEYFVDSSTGKLVYDVADSAGNLKSAASYTKTVYFQ